MRHDTVQGAATRTAARAAGALCCDTIFISQAGRLRHDRPRRCNMACYRACARSDTAGDACDTAGQALRHDGLLTVDLRVMDMSEFDVILGTDWLTAYRVVIDCERKRVTAYT